MERALERLDGAYADEFRSHRLALGESRMVLESDPNDATRAAVVEDLLARHRAAAAVALRAAEREGGPGWLSRAGHDDAWAHEHLWDGHGQPLTGVWWVQLAQGRPT
jgi:hypothetical protein